MGRHAKTDSDVTSLAASTPPRSPRGRPAYYVLSPAASHPDVHVGASGGVAGTTPAESPLHYHFHHHHRSSSGVGVGVGAGGGGGGVHHSRESSTGRLLFSDQLRSGGDVAAVVSVPWRRLGNGSGAGSVGDDDDEDDASLTRGGFADSPWRCYAFGAFAFFAVFAFFLLVLWGASRSYKPHVVVKSVVFESYHIQGGTDRTGVPTKMMSVNATVRLRFRNRGTFFSLHVSATPFLLFYGDLTVASGDMAEFYQQRKSGRMVTVSVVGKQVPLYGAGAGLHSKPNNGRLGAAVVPVRLDFVLRARAHILGALVKSKFYRRVHCRLDVREAHLGKPAKGVAAGCEYHDGLPPKTS